MGKKNKKQLALSNQSLNYSKMIISWKEIVDRFLNESDLRASTKESYSRRLRQFLIWVDDNKITELTPFRYAYRK